MRKIILVFGVLLITLSSCIKQGETRINLDGNESKLPEELKGFELKNVLGQWAMLSIAEVQRDGNTYTNINSVNPVPQAIKKNGLPDGKNDLKLFSIEEADMELFESFSDNLKNKIRMSPEWENLHGGPSTGNSAASANFDDMENDLPF